jgi:chaperonin cofactor prefoldin
MSEPGIPEQIEELKRAVERLQARVEDLEDLRDLEAAIAENAGKPLIPWERVKAEDDLEFTPEFQEGKVARVREPEGS